MVGRKVAEKTKKIFGSSKNGRIFASAFDKKTGVNKKNTEKARER